MIKLIKAVKAFINSGNSSNSGEFYYRKPAANSFRPAILPAFVQQKRAAYIPVKATVSIFFTGITSLSLTLLSACESSKGNSTVTNEQVPAVVAEVKEKKATSTPVSKASVDTVAKTAVPTDTLTTVKENKAVTAPEEAEVMADASVEWPVKGPAPLPGALLPDRRIIAFYGNPLSKRMGILGELPPDEMLALLDKEVAAWEKADPSTPVQPALHVIVVTAQGEPGRDNKYRLRMTNRVSEQVLEWAEQRKAIVFLDIQVGHSTLQEELPKLTHFLQLPNVHLGIDAEFAMKDGTVPGKKMGTFDAADINYATSFLADLVDEHQIPPKVFIVHRFTQKMITNSKDIKLDPRVQIVMHMDGWGAPSLKKDTYRRYIYREPVQFTGFKLFYKNDTRNGNRMMTPEEILKLHPKPLYIQYQ